MTDVADAVADVVVLVIVFDVVTVALFDRNLNRILLIFSASSFRKNALLKESLNVCKKYSK